MLPITHFTILPTENRLEGWDAASSTKGPGFDTQYFKEAGNEKKDRG